MRIWDSCSVVWLECHHIVVFSPAAVVQPGWLNQRYAAAARCHTPGKSECSIQASTCSTGGVSCVLRFNKYYCS